jgi:hypothetical protein
MRTRGSLACEVSREGDSRRREWSGSGRGGWNWRIWQDAQQLKPYTKCRVRRRRFYGPPPPATRNSRMLTISAPTRITTESNLMDRCSFNRPAAKAALIIHSSHTHWVALSPANAQESRPAGRPAHHHSRSICPASPPPLLCPLMKVCSMDRVFGRNGERTCLLVHFLLHRRYHLLARPCRIQPKNGMKIRV